MIGFESSLNSYPIEDERKYKMANIKSAKKRVLIAEKNRRQWKKNDDLRDSKHSIPESIEVIKASELIKSIKEESK